MLARVFDRRDGFQVSPADPTAHGAGFDDDAALQEQSADFGLRAGDVRGEELVSPVLTDGGDRIHLTAVGAFRCERGVWNDFHDAMAVVGRAFADDDLVFEGEVEEFLSLASDTVDDSRVGWCCLAGLPLVGESDVADECFEFPVVWGGHVQASRVFVDDVTEAWNVVHAVAFDEFERGFA